jgi:ABC-type lipoprotein release transport system permease subunit
LTAVLVRWRAELRRRWAAWLGVALVAGLGGGVVVGLLAGASRTTKAYPELVAAKRAADVLIGGDSPFVLREGRFAGAVDLDQVERLPQVKKTARAAVTLLFTGETGSGRRVGPVDLLPIIPSDEQLGSTIEAWRMVDGRPADQSRPDEATASFVLADRLGLHVGDTLRLRFVRASGFETTAVRLLSNFGARLSGDPGSSDTSIRALADGPDVTFKIVGIEASPLEFPPLGPDLSPALHLTTAFGKRYASQLVDSPLMYVQLRDPSLLDAFAKGVERLGGGAPVGFVESRAFQQPKVETAINAQAIALRLVALLVFVALLFVVAQGLVRQAYAEARDDQVLLALGMERTKLYLLGGMRGLYAGVIAAVVAFVVAVAVSPFMPIGIARTAELDRGFEIDPLVVGLGMLAIVALVVVLRLFAAWRVARVATGARSRRRPSLALQALDRTTLPPTAEAGMRFALDPGQGAASVPVWTSVLGVTLTIALLAGLWSFEASLRHLLDTPHLYGWNWSARSGAPALPDLAGSLVPAFEHDPAVAAFSSGTVTQAELGLQRVDVMAMKQERGGTVAPTLLEGRLPTRPNEVMLGTSTLDDAGLSIGDIAVLRLGNHALGQRVVGRGVFPEFGDSGRLGNGVFMTFAGLKRLLPEAQRNVFFVRFNADTNVAANVAHLRSALDPVPTRDTGQPRELQELQDVTGLPTVLGLLLALIAAATLAHTLLSSVRRRRHELAVLEALGFVRRQVWFTLAWETTTLVSLALVIGLPLGALVGRFAWSVFAKELGAVPEPQVAWLPLVLAIPVALLVANLIAAIPAWVATRARPALALRAE